MSLEPCYLLVPVSAEPQPAIALRPGSYFLGRESSSDIRLENPTVSALHAQLTVTPTNVFVEDLASTNGTYVDGQRAQRAELSVGGSLALGAEVFRLEDPRHPFPYAAASEETALLARATVAEALGRRPAATAQSARACPFCRRFLPLLDDLASYGRDALRGDLYAGVTVAVLLVPQGMAYSLLAGLPPIAGLYAALLPPLIYALLGTARQLSVGPVALDSLIVAAGVGAMAQSGTTDYWLLASLLALFVGAIQLTMGVLKGGFLVNFLSSPVITGFTSAAALIIGVTQVKHILGIEVPSGLGPGNTLIYLATHLGDARAAALGLGLGGLVLLQVTKRWKAFPAPLVLVVGSAVIVWAGGLAEADVRIVGTVPGGLPAVRIPSLSLDQLQALAPLAATLSLVGFMETISVGKALGRAGGYTIKPNQELMAVGIANIGAGLTSAYPVTGGLSRSAVNARAGARTGVASILAALGIGLTLTFLTPLFHYLPTAALAAIILMAVSGLIDRGEIRRIWRTKRSEGAIMLLTFLATVGLGIQAGILIGVGASILLFIALNTRPPAAILGRLPGTEIYRNLRDFPQAEVHAGVVVLRIDASFYFANAEFIKETLRNLCELQGSHMKAVILSAGSINDLDSTADAVLHEVADDLQRRNVRLYVADVKSPVREVMKRSGLYNKIGANRFFYSVDAAVRRALGEEH